MSNVETPRVLFLDYRLRITGPRGGKSYLTRINDKLDYFAESLTPLALPDLIPAGAWGNAAEITFALDDCTDGAAAQSILQNALNQIWANNAPETPQVDVLAEPTR